VSRAAGRGEAGRRGRAVRGLVPMLVILGGLALAFTALGLGARDRPGTAAAAAVVGLAAVAVGLAALARR